MTIGKLLLFTVTSAVCVGFYAHSVLLGAATWCALIVLAPYHPKA